MVVRKIQVPPSKSITHRALVCAALAHGESTIKNPLVCDDTLTTLRALEDFGVSIEKEKVRWVVHGRPWQKPTRIIDCKESGTTYRFLTATTQALGISCEITGKPSLLKRPMDDRLTSQLLSGRLLPAPLAKETTVIELTAPPVSQPYVALTIAVQKKFGVSVVVENNFTKFTIAPQVYQPTDFSVEGDWSSAAFLLAVGVLKNGVTLAGLNPKSLQGDRVIETILKEMGAEIFWEGERLVAKPSALRAMEWDFSQTPDLYPIVSVLCALAKGKSQLKGVERLRSKESDRVAAMENLLKITTRCQAPGGTLSVDSTDHRIIMAAAILELAGVKSLKIKNKKKVAKSFPGFWDTLSTI